MKKFLSILMVLAMILALSTTAFAAENDTHTLTITGATGHVYDDDKDEDCNVCLEIREIKGLSGGAIAGIAAGSTVAAGAGGFSLFWFVIKKKSGKS